MGSPASAANVGGHPSSLVALSEPSDASAGSATAPSEGGEGAQSSWGLPTTCSDSAATLLEADEGVKSSWVLPKPPICMGGRELSRGAAAANSDGSSGSRV